MMKIMVVGAGGFLGSSIVSKLSKKYVVIPIVRVKKNVGDIACDIGDSNALLGILNKHSPNFIINCAAKVDFSEKSRLVQYRVNALAPALMAGWCVENNVHLLHASSISVNENTLKKIGLGSLEKPTSLYGETKLLADIAIKTSGCKFTIIRFGGIFGENGPNHLGVNKAIKVAKSGDFPTVFGNGLALRNYIHVQDASDLIINCLEGQITGLHYAGNHQPISIAQMLKDICDIYLEGRDPLVKDGLDSIDQITEVSQKLPQTMPFKVALLKFK
jgi:dTDP-4-dehydrorhamnose reductase